MLNTKNIPTLPLIRGVVVGMVHAKSYISSSVDKIPVLMHFC